MITREQAITQLQDAGWPAVADDLADGTSAYQVLRNLGEIGESFSSAARIVSELHQAETA